MNCPEHLNQLQVRRTRKKPIAKKRSLRLSARSWIGSSINKRNGCVWTPNQSATKRERGDEWSRTRNPWRNNAEKAKMPSVSRRPHCVNQKALEVRNAADKLPERNPLT